jgi:hypothetical protein
MCGHAATVCTLSVVNNIITCTITPTVMTRLQHVPRCEMDTLIHTPIHRGRHHQLGLSVRARVAQRPMTAVFFQASFASAPGGRPRLPMLLQPWKCTVNTNLPELLRSLFLPFLFPYFQSYDTDYTLLHNQIWCFMHEFTPVISCIWFRFHAVIRQRILSFKFWINAIFATFSLLKKWSVLSGVSVNGAHNPICQSSHGKLSPRGTYSGSG